MSETTVKVWDPFVRLFHWSLVASFAVAWLSADEWDDLHEWAGYAAGALIAFRLIWGLIGPDYARFTQFVRSPGRVVGFLKSMAERQEKRYLGHNPAGAAMIIALLLTMAAVATTGYMYTLDAFWGVEWVEEAHEVLAHVLLVLVLVHIGGVLYASHAHRENLVKAMLTGRKRAAGPGDIA